MFLNSKCVIRIQTVLFDFKLCYSNSNCVIQTNRVIRVPKTYINYVIAKQNSYLIYEPDNASYKYGRFGLDKKG